MCPNLWLLLLHVCVYNGKTLQKSYFVSHWSILTKQYLSFYFIPSRVAWRSLRMQETLWRKHVRWSTATVTCLMPSSQTTSRRKPSLSCCESLTKWTSSRSGSLLPGSAKKHFHWEIMMHFQCSMNLICDITKRHSLNKPYWGHESTWHTYSKLDIMHSLLVFRTWPRCCNMDFSLSFLAILWPVIFPSH